MSTPTITALSSQNFYPPYQDYHNASLQRPPNLSVAKLSQQPNYDSSAASSPIDRQLPPLPTHRPPHTNGVKPEYSNMAESSNLRNKQQSKKTNWNDFYKNGLPKEVIVIDDDSPDATTGDSGLKRTTSQHENKRRRTDAAYENMQNGYSKQAPRNLPHVYDDANSSSTASSARNTSALYSTAPTSLTSVSSGNGQQMQQRLDEERAGQKRKRTSRYAPEEETPEVEVTSHKQAWTNYIPPAKPPVKAGEVYTPLIRDKAASSHHKIDDEDGHYIVNPDTDLTDRYEIRKLLGQGTFGKVVEAYDKDRATKCAIKIIRAVPKYRDASRIELRVLSTLKSNDRSNRNRCIHLRDCFDFRNHICIVTDLLGSSVFDFLKLNGFVPFPSTHIQSFARQLLTSVAFLHDLNLIHTDLKPENILLVSNAYQTFTYNRQIPASSRAQQRSAKYRKVLLDPEIRLIDFGSATFDDEYHSSVVSTRHYRAPEIILNLGWSYPCDIWSIGCILVEFFTGDALFQTHDNLEHLAMMESVCDSKIEKETIQQVRASNRGNKNSAAQFFLPRAFRLDYPNSETPRTSRKYVRNMKRLDETIPPATAFNKSFLDLLKKIFVYDPKKRITAKQALQHQWFRENLQDDGTEALKIKLARERSNGYR
ncbi:MAG: hypothetical protein Q9162_004087 [Coniocarpon cinnabarinum]